MCIQNNGNHIEQGFPTSGTRTTGGTSFSSGTRNIFQKCKNYLFSQNSHTNSFASQL